ncbi:DDE-domain-containing protein, partial [Ascobolus immersus RN42]
PTVSGKWSRRFLKRHPEYLIQRQYTMESDRKTAQQTPEEIKQWLEKFRALCKQYKIKATDIWNADKSGFRVGIGKDQFVITLDASRRPTLGSASCRELVTVIECVSAAGAAIDPMVVMPGSDHLEDWYAETGLGDDYAVAVSDTGYINDAVSLEWVHHFDEETRKVQVGEYRLLLLDGHISHCTVEFVRYCDDNKIIPLCLLPHTTHFLQPLDVMIFQPYKHFHSKAIEEATRLGNPDFDKIEFLANLTSIRQQAMKETTIRSSFRATGLEPFDVDLVLDKL